MEHIFEVSNDKNGVFVIKDIVDGKETAVREKPINEFYEEVFNSSDSYYTISNGEKFLLKISKA